MARPTKYATPICVGLSIVALVGIVVGLVADSVMVPIVLLVPTVVYEAYRTEGRTTRWASWTMLVLLVGLIATRMLDVEFDLRELVGADVVRAGDREIPLGDLTVVLPAAMGALAIVLWTRTRGVYTRWLAAIVVVTSAAIVHLAAPEALGDLFGAA